MIFIQADEGQTIELEIRGYQFPEKTLEKEELDWDANWLRIALRIHHKEIDWVAIDPSLLTIEVKELVDWFDSISKNNEVKWTAQSFVEPNISITLVNNVKDEPKRLVFHFAYESVPKAFYNKGIDIPCTLSNEQLRQVSIDFGKELEKFPVRK